MNKKFIILGFSVLMFSLYLLFKNSVNWGFCGVDEYVCRERFNDNQWNVSFTPYLLIVAITVSFLSKQYFEKWWKFAVWGLPLSIFLIVGIYSDWFSSQSGGVDPFKTGFVALQVKLVYFFFIIGSLIQLYRAYREGRGLVVKKK